MSEHRRDDIAQLISLATDTATIRERVVAQSETLTEVKADLREMRVFLNGVVTRGEYEPRHAALEGRIKALEDDLERRKGAEIWRNRAIYIGLGVIGALSGYIALFGSAHPLIHIGP